jgi:hypothetical protein
MQLNGIRVYVAGPYTKPDPVINTKAAVEAGDHLLRLGYVPFIPHLTLMWHMLRPHEYQDWLDYDNEWVKLCNAVLRLPGESSGADGEEELARALEIPVFYSIEDLHSAFQAA